MLEHRRDQKVGRALAIEQEKRHRVALKEQQAAYEEQLLKAYQEVDKAYHEADDAIAKELAAQTAMQKIQAETQSKMQIKQAEIAFEIEKQREEANLKSMLMDKEFSMNIQLAKIQQDGISERENQKEKEKSKR